MINWAETKIQLNRIDLKGIRPKVVVQCDLCGTQKIIAIRKKSKVVNMQMPWECNKCIANKPEKRKKSKDGALKAWKDQKYRNKITKNSHIIWEDNNLRKRMSAFRNSPNFKRHMARINKRKVTQQSRTNQSIASKKVWMNPEYRSHMIERISEISKKSWAKPEYREKIQNAMLKNWEDKDYRSMMIQTMRDNWQNPKFRNKMISVFGSDKFRRKMAKISREVWSRPGYKEKMIPMLQNARSNVAKVSSLNTILYGLLDDLGIEYCREYEDKQDDPQCIIGPYSFDCVIPRSDKPDLLIECQGDYWHSLSENKSKDKAKSSYISNNFPGQYELKYLWEHEFSNRNKIKELLKLWTGITNEVYVDFSFDDAVVKACPASDYKLLLSKYHYLPNAGRGGIAYGAYLNNELVAVCVFSPLIRQNIRIPDKYSKKECRELSRLCIHPSYQKKNFGSWFISRCLKQLDDKYKYIIAYCDTTFNHDGAVYKASNFEFDGEIKPDYWYISMDGWVMHKRTLYGHARKMKMKEKEYADKYGYMKVYGNKKLRFVYQQV